MDHVQPSPTAQQHVSDYDKKVQANIAENQKVMASFGLVELSKELNSAPRDKSQSKSKSMQNEVWKGPDQDYEDDAADAENHQSSSEDEGSGGDEVSDAPERQLRTRTKVKYREPSSDDENPPPPSSTPVASQQPPKTSPPRALSSLASALPGCNEEQDSNEAHPSPSAGESSQLPARNAAPRATSPVASPSAGYSPQVLEQTSNEGKFVLWLNRNAPEEENGKEEVFFMLGAINKEPVWEGGLLWLHTEDFDCSQDARWPCSLADAHFFRSKTGGQVDDNWLNVSEDNFDVLILGIFAKLTRMGGKKKAHQVLPRGVRQRAMEILEENKHVAHVHTFMNQQEGDRPRTRNRQSKK